MLQNKHQILSVGRSGHGKTLGILSWANHEETKPIHVLSLDNRTYLLESTPGVTYTTFNAKDGYTKVDQELESYLRKGNNLPFKTLLVCGITALIDLLILDCSALMKDVKQKDDSSKYVGQRIGSLYIPGMRDYLYVSEAMRQIFYNGLFLLPCNIIVEANIVNDYDRHGNVEGFKILAPDKTSEKIPTFFDEIWEFKKKNSADIERKPTWKIHFQESIARTSYTKLLEKGSIDFTDKDLYQEISSVLGG